MVVVILDICDELHEKYCGRLNISNFDDDMATIVVTNYVRTLHIEGVSGV